VGKQNTFRFIANIIIIQKADEKFKFFVSENERDVWVSKLTEYATKAL